MRALILHGPGDLRLQEVARPVPGAGEVVVAIDAALTCATDAKMLARGRHPALGPLPAAFGHEGTGSVAAIGRGVRGVGEGDAVAFANSAPCGTCEWCLAGREGLCAHITYLTGTYAEYLRVPAAIVRTNVVRPPGGTRGAARGAGRAGRLRGAGGGALGGARGPERRHPGRRPAGPGHRRGACPAWLPGDRL